MSQLLRAVFDVPQLVHDLFSGQYVIYSIIVLIVFLLAALLNNKVAHAVRELIVLIGIVIGLIAYFKHRPDISWLALFMLVILGIICLLRYLLITIRQNRINKRIERRALEKAAMRRGSWKEKKGYSGKKKAVDEDPPIFYTMNADEVKDVVNNETTERQGAKIPVDDARITPVQNAFTQEVSDGTLSRTVVIDAIQKLTDLRDLGVLTDEEFVEKRTWLYAHLG